MICNVIKQRRQETHALHGVLKGVDSTCIIKPPLDVSIEGGDVLLTKEYLFLGYTNNNDFKINTVHRTNQQAIRFLQMQFPDYPIKAFELCKSDHPEKNVLHLDCCFQPIGNHMAILYPVGFKNKKDINFLIKYYGEDRIIFVDQQEMYHMCANVFSISDNVIVSEKTFVRLNAVLRKKGFVVEEVAFSEVAKMGGLFRCATLPLVRSDP
ncbi:MAG: arginine deiminase family protein [Pseudomonadota bacterium]|nr:arginine deiminase family protein [Pseudomonadota bacterium]